ncbi:uncharacterized protein LOC119276532 isoform X2 [Triticum dicoccoides]|uniref:uncharacterized protein LOC119276532 isoform X2 n=1 Tax=Triticum dicoccoides TaxID=85692 RepID=UPI00188FC4EE|nr:uncharacterized protein LOC119276532 isoform X2 [Triticum dicoccoides]XP_044349431.1 uncharacterized protein LOC123070345 isoform X2 [Triticum aestivum]
MGKTKTCSRSLSYSSSWWAYDGGPALLAPPAQPLPLLLLLPAHPQRREDATSISHKLTRTIESNSRSEIASTLEYSHRQHDQLCLKLMNKCKDQKLELLLTGSSTSRVAPGSSTSRPAWEEQQLADEQQVEERSGGDDRGLEVEDELQFQARRELQVQALETQARAGPGWREGIEAQPWAA